MGFNDELSNLVENYMIWIDTCSLLDIKFDIFIGNLEQILISKNKKIYLPYSVINELEKHSNQSNRINERAKLVVEKVTSLIKHNILEMKSENENKFADNDFAVLFTRLRLDNNLLLITQDVNLAYDICNLNNSKSSKGKTVLVKKIGQQGQLYDFKFDSEKNFNKTNRYEKSNINFDFGKILNMTGNIINDVMKNTSNNSTYYREKNERKYSINNNFHESFGTKNDISEPVNGNLDADINGSLNGNINGNLNGDINGILDGDINGSLGGNINGKLNGDVNGSLNGDVNGILRGNIIKDLNGDINGQIMGNIEGNLYGDINGRMIGNIEGDLYGEILGDFNGKVFGRQINKI